MEKIHFLLLKKLKNTRSAQLCLIDLSESLYVQSYTRYALSDVYVS